MKVFKSTHDLNRSELMQFIQGAREKRVTPEELDAWLLALYLRLDLKLEDDNANIE